MYQALAKIYDEIMTRVDYSAWVTFVCQAHRMLCLPSPSTAVDLASGTAGAGLELAKRGMDVLAVDLSSEMLSRAKERALAMGLSGRFRFQQADLALWKPQEQFDLALCCCDGLNYLPKAAIAGLFSQLAVALRPGSLFVFDLNTPFKYCEIFSDNVFAENFPAFSYIWENKLKQDSCDFKLTIFLREGELFQRYQEDHTQYIHTQEEIAYLLASSGFSWRGVFDSYQWLEPREDCQRWTIIAQR
jgi:SAM-dependent methyltransferase